MVLTTPEALKAIIAQDEENKEWTDPVAEELAKLMKGRQRLPHLSFFAFTATPKTKTLEVFGKPRLVVTPEGVKKVEHEAFHTYTMRQAIEEKFILDVLQSYTTYSTYFELLENEKAPPGYEIETAKGRRLLMKHVGKHPHTIESKAKIMLDHFFSKTVHKIDGEAKAMVVTSSRAHAVLYKQAFDRLLREDYASQTQALVAFSGKVTIKGHGAPYTEGEMNPKDAKDIRAAFKKQKYRILIVANKFQTGFDQPLLHTMYVDKKLGGVATVQTLSRLNRKGPPAKLDTMVLDFVNKQEDIENDFQDYYGKTTLDRGTDPQKLYNMKFEVEELGVFTPAEVNEFAELFVIQKAPGQKISPLFTKIIQGRFAKLKEEDQEKFRDALRRYVSQYSFVSQIITWIDPDLEKFYLFTKLLLKYLPPKKDALPEEILDMVDMDKFRLQEQENGSIVLNLGDTEMENISGDGHKDAPKPDKDKLEVIVKELNDRFHFDFEDRDKVLSIVIPKLTQDAGLIAAFQTNNLETLRKQKFAESLESAFISSASDFYSVLNRMSAEPDFKRLLTEFALSEFTRSLSAPETAAAVATSPTETVGTEPEDAAYSAACAVNLTKFRPKDDRTSDFLAELDIVLAQLSLPKSPDTALLRKLRETAERQLQPLADRHFGSNKVRVTCSQVRPGSITLAIILTTVGAGAYQFLKDYDKVKANTILFGGDVKHSCGKLARAIKHVLGGSENPFGPKK